MIRDIDRRLISLEARHQGMAFTRFDMVGLSDDDLAFVESTCRGWPSITAMPVGAADRLGLILHGAPPMGPVTSTMSLAVRRAGALGMIPEGL